MSTPPNGAGGAERADGGSDLRGVPATRAEILHQYLRQGKCCAECHRHLCLAHDFLFGRQGSPLVFCAECAGVDASTGGSR